MHLVLLQLSKQSGHKEGRGQAKSNFVPIIWGEKQGTVKMEPREQTDIHRELCNVGMLTFSFTELPCCKFSSSPALVGNAWLLLSCYNSQISNLLFLFFLYSNSTLRHPQLHCLWMKELETETIK